MEKTKGDVIQLKIAERDESKRKGYEIDKRIKSEVEAYNKRKNNR